MTTATDKPSAQVCDGCGEDHPLLAYLLTYHSGDQDRVHYCDECAGLARVDWNGHVASIAEVNTP